MENVWESDMCGKLQPSLKKHASDKLCHLLKFVSFTDKNVNYPFWVKKKVLDAALLSALTYGCESWLSEDLKSMQPHYMSAIKSLLGVRKTTPNDLCLVEIGYPTLKGFVKDKQMNFFVKLLENRRGQDDDPFWRVWSLCREANTPCARYVNKLLEIGNGDIILRDIEDTKQKIVNSDGSKFLVYKEMNPLLSVHSVYSSFAFENQRISFSKLRLSSHDLLIEKGRWSRIPRDRRLCTCNAVQTELHVLSTCPRTQQIREDSPDVDCSSFETFFNCDDRAICKVIHRCLTEFE